MAATPDGDRGQLARILGLSFGLAVVFGGSVGVGILRLPGTIAGELGVPWLILLAWALGGLYALLCAISVAELGAANPQAGGFYVYSKRAFGPATGFAMGWADWLNNCAAAAFGAVAVAEYLTAFVPALAGQARQTATALTLLTLFCGLHWLGLRLSSGFQKLTSSVTAVTFLLLAGACLLHSRPLRINDQSGTHPIGLVAMLVPVIAAMRAIVVVYDGWYGAIYFTEEDTDAARHLPRAMIGGVLLVVCLYLLMNLAFLHVLSVPALAHSKLPAADAAELVLPSVGGTFVTVLSLMTLFSMMNAVLLSAPRILFAIGRDGLFRLAARVGPDGTPRAASLASAGMVAIFVAIGRFDDILGVVAILVATMYCVNFVAVFVLRVREPEMTRPFRAWGYPLTTGIVLLGSTVFLVADVHDDPVSAMRAGVLLAVAIPAYWWKRRKTT